MDRVHKVFPKTYYQRGGRLIKYLWRWKKIGGLSCVGYGITANYIDKPKAFYYFAKHKKWNEYHETPKMQAEYDKIVGDWVKTGTIEKCPYKKLIWVNLTHLVPKPGGKFRLVTDCTRVNKYMKHTHFKMEVVPTLKDIIEKNKYAIMFDLKEAYNHVPVHHSMKNILGRCWREEAYRFVGMPFGLNNAPRVYTKIMKHVVKIIREVIQFLQWLGWTVNVNKSHLVPSRQFWYLGWEWNSEKMDVTLTPERRLKTLDELRRMKRSVHNHKLIPVCNVMKLMGILSAGRI
jgi:hypothetical protein